MNYTLQFLPVGDRRPLLGEIFRTLNPGGMLFLSEKVRFPASLRQELVTMLYEDFKRGHGYSESEIARKKEALENILVPLTIAEHEEALLQCGFAHVSMLSLWLNFCTWLAMKEEAH
jgi:tRNA (cmo5U34)-methyltransferase